MDIRILDRGAFSSAMVHLQPGESFVSEAGAMYRASDNIHMDVTMRKAGKGGFWAGVKRLLASESMFFSTYRVTDASPGEIGLAPTLQGEIAVLDCDDQRDWICTGGSFLGCTEELELDTQFQGIKGFVTGESISFLKVHGGGKLIVNAFGRIERVEVQGGLTVDTGHVVAFQDTLKYSMSKAGGSWMQSWLAGEGIVMNFEGEGSIYVQSHNPQEFGGLLGPLLPERQ